MAYEVSIEPGIVYGSGGGRNLKCDLYRPLGLDAPAPGVLLVHGGSWIGGAPTSMKAFAEHLAGEGFVCVAPEYRLLGESPWPAQINDIKAAIRWLRAFATELGVDPTAVALQGNSAGAHLVLLAAGTPNDARFAGEGGNAGIDESIAAVVAIYPPTVFYRSDTRPRGASPASSLLKDDASDADIAAAGPLSHVSPTFPPTFLIHGTDDKTVPPSASMVMYEALVKARIPVSIHMYAQEPHGFVRQPAVEPLIGAEIAHFLGRFVKTAIAQDAATAGVA